MRSKNKKYRIVLGILVGLIALVLVIGITGKEKNDEIESDEPETPSDYEKLAIYEVFGEENIFYEDEDSIESIQYDEDTKHADVYVYSSSNFSKKSIKQTALYNITDSLEIISENDAIESINFEILYPLQNEYGEESDEPITKAS